MTSKKVIIESLAMDLKRVALGLYKGSYAMADRFKQEALSRSQELEGYSLDNHLQKLLQGTRRALKTDRERTAEDALMYSTLFQNFALKKM